MAQGFAYDAIIRSLATNELCQMVSADHGFEVIRHLPSDELA